GRRDIIEALHDSLELVLETVILGYFSQLQGNEIQVTYYDRQRCGEFVSHAGGQCSDRCHAIRDEQLLLDLPLFRANVRLAHFPGNGGAQPRKTLLEDVVSRTGLHGRDGHLFSYRPRDDDEWDVEVSRPQELQRCRAAKLRH